MIAIRSKPRIARAFVGWFVALILFSRGAAAADVDKEALREKFRAGLTQYEQGHLEEALEIWRPIYAALGREEGYRLAFNIARAEEGRGDSRAAATWYAAYLTGVDSRRARGEPIEAGMLGQEVEARDRLAKLARELVRIESPVPGALLGVDAEPEVTTPTTLYVLPGPHTVRLVRDGRSVAVRHEDFARGALVLVNEPEPPPPAVVAPTPQPPPRVLRHVRPYPAALPLTVLGLAGVGAVTTIAGYTHANGVYDDYVAAGPSSRTTLADSYASARTVSYVSLAVTLVLSAGAAALGTYYWLGTTERSDDLARRR